MYSEVRDLKKRIVFISIIIILIVGYAMINKPTYGNTLELIEEVLTSIDFNEDKSIQIFGIYDFDDDRIVPFLSNDAPSIIEFERNERGNYVRRRAETRSMDKLSNFIITHVGDKNEVVVFSVRNQFSNIDEFSFKANENLYKVKFDKDSPNVEWTKLIKSADGGYKTKWYYPDE